MKLVTPQLPARVTERPFVWIYLLDLGEKRDPLTCVCAVCDDIICLLKSDREVDQNGILNILCVAFLVR